MVAMSAPQAAVRLFVVLAAMLLGAAANAESDPAARPWSDAYPLVVQDLAAGNPLVVEVLVPLCSNDQIWCGSKWAGQPASLRSNLYWGAIFGARTHFQRKTSGWTPLGQTAPDGVFLERAVFRRWVPATKWGLGRREPVEQIVVLHAVHGNHINGAVKELYLRAARGSSVTIDEDGNPRRLRVHAIGYAGHNRLMDGVPFPPKLPATRPGDAPIASFVLACLSEKYFTNALRAVGSEPVVMTSSYMAPEGYVVDAVVKGLGDNDSIVGVRRRAVSAYAQWQRISPGQASAIFAPR
jgi:hypothetical protein